MFVAAMQHGNYTVYAIGVYSMPICPQDFVDQPALFYCSYHWFTRVQTWLHGSPLSSQRKHGKCVMHFSHVVVWHPAVAMSVDFGGTHRYCYIQL